MSIIQQIREKAAWLVFGVIALSLIGFLLMDAFGTDMIAQGVRAFQRTIGNTGLQKYVAIVSAILATR